MRKTYPYLQNPYVTDLNVESQKRHFLSCIDDFVNQRQYVKMTLLDWEENPLKSIEGIISSGSISKDGASSVRRTCSLSCSVNGEEYNVDEMGMDFSLNKKIFIEIGVKNDSPYYPEYPILWFPQGVFFITSFSMNSSTSSAVNLSLGLKDKMAMLNGEIGGMLPSTVQFDSMDTQVSSGEWVQQKVLIYNIIAELVHHYGGEDINNIIIEDVPLRIRKIMKWAGKNKLYGWIDFIDEDTGVEQWVFSLQEPENEDYYIYEYGADVGYIYSDFVIPNELYGAPGDSVCSILDQIKELLGNYEYFYDEMGIFHFREVKNFLNVTQGEFLLDNMSENDYLIETTNEKASYAFEDNKNITSITVTPQYENIKNDFVVHGLRQSDESNLATLIMYHLVIDKKPSLAPDIYEEASWPSGRHYGMFENIAYYTDPLDGLHKLTKYIEVDNLPDVGNFNTFYYIEGDGLYYWDNTVYKKASIITGRNEEGEPIEEDPILYSEYYVRDWRTYLYLYGLEAQMNGTDEGIYFAELNAFWPKEYNLKHDEQDFYGLINSDHDTYLTLTEGNYFLDFIDTDSELGIYSVAAIGRRSDVIQNDDINCLFEPEIPNIIFLNIDSPTDNASENTTLTDDQDIDRAYREKVDSLIDEATLSSLTKEEKMIAIQRAECILNAHPWTQVHEDIYSNLAVGGYKNAAYEKIRYELFLHTNYQKTVSITALPAFYLEPNTRVALSDRTTNTYGDFMIQNISLTLGPGANMAVTLSEVFERL